MWIFKMIKNFFQKKDWCIVCGTKIPWMIQVEWVHRKKCSNCQTVNYRVKVYSWDHNNYTLKLGTKEEYENEKKQRDNYYSDIYPRTVLKKEFWEEMVEWTTKRAEEKKGEEATPDEVELEILLSKTEHAEDLKGLTRLYHKIVNLRLKLRQYKLWSQDFVKFLYYEQFNILRNQCIEQEIWRRVKIEIEANNFESICKNTSRNLKWIFEEFNRWGISLLDLKIEFEHYINDNSSKSLSIQY